LFEETLPIMPVFAVSCRVFCLGNQLSAGVFSGGKTENSHGRNGRISSDADQSGKSETLTTVCERREDGFFGMSGGFIGGTGFRFGWFRGA